ncbi:MAG: hypothetical protein AAGF35_09920, partial [Pseudomonadota bacterium]
MRGLCRALLVTGLLGLIACGGDNNDPPVLSERPTFDWGYPEYSEYDADGNHIGETIYQFDSACQTRLSFYQCDAVDANEPNNPFTNPTSASSNLNGGIDVCTAALVDEQPSYCMPADVCNPRVQRTAWAPGQASTDNLSWQLFFAINWPADADQPGYPDTSRLPGARESATSDEYAQTVWLDYPTADQVFGLPSLCEGPTLTMNSKVSMPARDNTPELNDAGGGAPSETLVGLGDEPTGGVLVDQDGEVVRYDIRVNRTMWEFIVNQNDYWKTGTSLADLKQNVRRNYHFDPGQTPGAFPAAVSTEPGVIGREGAMEIKAAWKKLTEDQAASGDFYTRTFSLYDDDAPENQRCTQAKMGLIGLHIAYQPAQFGNPEWVWATFEHRANVPTSQINDNERDFLLYDEACSPVLTPEQCAAYTPGVDSPMSFRCCPNLMLYPNSDNLPLELSPNQVVRNINPTISTILPTRCNEFYQQSLTNFFGPGNVWRNYFLVSNQWPLRGASTNFPFYEPPFEANFPCLLRNSTMETFLVDTEVPALNGCSINDVNPFCRTCNGDCVATQEEADQACPGAADSSNQETTATCMGCHGTFAPHNSSFIFSHRACCVRSDGLFPNQ